MRYELSAVVATADVLAPLHRRHRSARLVALDAAGLALVPAILVDCSCAGPVGYLEADYLGRDGRQTAAVWHHGAVVYGPDILGDNELFPGPGDNPIDAALRVLGVEAAGRRDEFVVVGLGRHRRTEDWH